MSAQQAEGWTRRRFLEGLTGAGTLGLFSLHARLVTAEPPPETTTIRLGHSDTLCNAPQFVAEALLQSEGFTEVHHISAGPGSPTPLLASGEIHISMGLGALQSIRIDAGDPIVILAGVHVGCYELFATERIRSVRDLKGKAVAVPALGGGAHTFLASMLAYVGLDPRQDIQWVIKPFAEAMELLAKGQIDGFLGFPPEPQELRARRIGRVVVNTAIDRPWSQYFCCMVAGNREFIQNHPIATKRALRAILKATDVCALEPDRVAQLIVDKGLTPRYDYALQTMQEIPYNRWRE